MVLSVRVPEEVGEGDGGGTGYAHGAVGEGGWVSGDAGMDGLMTKLDRGMDCDPEPGRWRCLGQKAGRIDYSGWVGGGGGVEIPNISLAVKQSDMPADLTWQAARR